VLAIETRPPVTLLDPNGNNSYIICSNTMDYGSQYSDGCNTPAQIADY
jgi:hypothetical protein